MCESFKFIRMEQDKQATCRNDTIAVAIDRVNLVLEEGQRLAKPSLATVHWDRVNLRHRQQVLVQLV